MPINGDLLGLQRRDAPLGEIRIGTSVEQPGKDWRKPVRLETFRFTTSEANANAVAALYGGKVAPWSQRKGKWEVITDRKALDVWVPPRGLAVDANMELWDGQKRLRHCDGRIEALSGKPCMCPRGSAADPESIQQAYNERKRLSKLRPPQACKPLTRINVTIPELPGLTGTWRLNTGSENAAVETAGSGDTMVIAREGGVYLPAVLSIQWRYRAEDGSPYPVPFLQIGLSMKELAKGQLPAGPGGLLAQLQGTASVTQALTGAQQARAISAPRVPAQASAPEVPVPEDPPADDGGMSAQYYADLVPTAKDRADIEALAAGAEADGVIGQMAQADDGTKEQLRAYLGRKWKALPLPAGEQVTAP